MKISSAWIFWKKVRDFINRSDFRELKTNGNFLSSQRAENRNFTYYPGARRTFKR
ncbi:hypothetical protein [Aquiflexum lacus]|uniref:hypothetical protein n=1 Tax=Aquiflexum lacus TaxID=2483805 RepID=UPI0018944D6C|nr:hypothetical protein [Aquiflexum lacus]